MGQLPSVEVCDDRHGLLRRASLYATVRTPEIEAAEREVGEAQSAERFGNYVRGKELARAALERARGVGSPLLFAEALHTLGTLTIRTGDVEEDHGSGPASQDRRRGRSRWSR
ncbi:MAG: hypothetical protein V3V08_09885 [Nannocystaceae bacterium]